MEPIAAAGWRAQVTPSARQGVVDKIVENLIGRLHISEPERCKEIQRIAVRLEEQIFTVATSQSDYLKKVCLKLYSIELKTQHALLTSPAMADTAVVHESSIYPAHGTQSQVSCDILPTLPASASLLPPQGADDQQKLFIQSQTNLPEVSLDAWVESTAENEHVDGIDWQQEIYEKIKTMKELYSVELIELHQKISMKLQQHDALETPIKRLKKFLEGILTILQLDKSNIQIALKDKLPSYEKLMCFLASHQRKVTDPQPQGQSQVPQPSLCAHSMLQQQQPSQVPSLPIVPSSSMPVASPSIQGETEKQFSNVASLPNARQNGHQLTTLPPPVLGMTGISASPMPAEIVCPNGNQDNIPTLVHCKASATETPLARILEVVQSENPEALSSAVGAIGSVITMMDGMAASAPLCGSRGAFGEDLAGATSRSLQAGSFMSMDGNTATTKMKRDIDAVSLSDVSWVGGANDNFVQSYSPDASELAPTMNSHVKRQKSEATN